MFMSVIPKELCHAGDWFREQSFDKERELGPRLFEFLHGKNSVQFVKRSLPNSFLFILPYKLLIRI